LLETAVFAVDRWLHPAAFKLSVAVRMAMR
jgi:hypothetical protein